MPRTLSRIGSVLPVLWSPSTASVCGCFRNMVSPRPRDRGRGDRGVVGGADDGRWSRCISRRCLRHGDVRRGHDVPSTSPPGHLLVNGEGRLWSIDDEVVGAVARCAVVVVTETSWRSKPPGLLTTYVQATLSSPAGRVNGATVLSRWMVGASAARRRRSGGGVVFGDRVFAVVTGRDAGVHRVLRDVCRAPERPRLSEVEEVIVLRVAVT